MIRQTQNILLLLFVLVWSGIAGLGYMYYSSYKHLEEVLERDMQAEALFSQLRAAHLNMRFSVRMAIHHESGTVRWETRYRQHNQVDSLMSELLPLLEEAENLHRMERAGVFADLADSEEAALSQLSKGEKQAAKAEVSQSEKYQEALTQANAFLSDIEQYLQEQRQTHRQTLEDRIISLIAVLVAGLLLFLFTVYFMYQFIRREKRMQARVREEQARNQKRLKAMSSFAEELGQGNYEVALDLEEEETDDLTRALLGMRDKLKSLAEEDRKRNWVTQGLAEAAEVMRGHEEINALCDDVLSFLLRYTEASQGGIFVLQDQEDQKENPYLELVSYNAFNRKKYQQKTLEIGQSLVGQAVQEKKLKNLTEIPEGYIEVTSGLGHADPRNLVIVPLIINEKVEGVLEIASLHHFEDHHLEFFEKVAESIASSISAMKVNARTKKLLENSEEMTQQMREQEEEMRQNMEEMQATQEDYERREKELNESLESLKEQLNARTEEVEELRRRLGENQSAEN